MLADHAFGLLGRGDSRPQGHEARPDADSLNQPFPVPGHALVQAVNLGIGQQVDVHAVIEPVALVPAVLVDRRPERGGVLGVVGRNLVQVEALAQVHHGQQLFVHQAVEVNGGGASRRPKEGAGVVVDADHGVALPVVQTATMPVVVTVIVHKGLKVLEAVTEPLRVSVLLLNEKRRMLGEHRLVHVVQVEISGLEGGNLLAARHADGNPAVHTAPGQVIQHASALAGSCLRVRLRRADHGQDLAKGHVAQP
jgi:hypothetical protein